MSRSRRVTGAELAAGLQRTGFVITRIRGSHHMLRHPDGGKTVVPVHSGETIGQRLFHKDPAGLRFDPG